MNSIFPVILITALSSAVGGIIFYLFWRYQKKSSTPVSKETKEISDTSGFDRGRMIIGKPEAPLIEFNPLPINSTSEIKGFNANLTAALGPLMELLPKAGEMTSPAMRVVFSKEVMQGLKNGTLELTKDGAGDFLAVARKVDSKEFFQHGKLLKTGIKVATLATAALQIATLITAQAHLAEITATLKKLEDRLDDISFFQKEEKRSELRGAVQLLRQYSDAISRGDLNEHEIAALYQKLEDIEQLCLSIGELGRELLLHEKNKLGGIQVNEFLDASGTVERGANWASNCKDAIELITMAQSCRVLGCFVKSAIPGDKTLIRERISNANHEVKSALQLLDDSKSKYRQLLVEPLNKAKRDWLLNPFGWDLAGRKKFPACALNRFSEAQMKAKEFGGGFHQHSDQVLSVVDQQECVAENGFYIDVQQSDAGRVEVVNLSGV